MIPSQPQQQAQYRPNRTSLWVNDRKSAANQPDYKGNLELSYALVQELLAAFSAGQYTQDRGGQPCVKLDIALYAQRVTPGDKKPILSGQLSTLAETQYSAVARQQAAQQYQQAAPQQVQPQPQQQQPQAPQPAPAQPQPVPGQLYGFQPQYGSPQPMQAQPQQSQAPEGWPAHVPWPAHIPYTAPAGWTAPQPPVAPPAPVQPMPGAIHGQPPAGAPQPQYAPTGLAPVLPQDF